MLDDDQPISPEMQSALTSDVTTMLLNYDLPDILRTMRQQYADKSPEWGNAIRDEYGRL